MVKVFDNTVVNVPMAWNAPEPIVFILSPVLCHEAFILIFAENAKESCIIRSEMFKFSDLHSCT